MSELPTVTVEHPRPPRRLRPETAGFMRLLLAIAIVVGTLIVCVRLAQYSPRSQESHAIEARHGQARTRVGNGLDALFARLLDRERTTVALAATLRVAPSLPDRGYDASDCALGLTAAFEDALGPHVVGVSVDDSREDIEIAISGTIAPSGSTFRLPHSAEEYPGIVLRGEVAFLGTTTQIATSPQASLEFKRFQSRFALDAALTSEDVAGGILQGTCREVGYTLLEQHTTWRRPAPPEARDPLVECKRGFHCREHAERVEATDPKLAAELYDEACQHRDEAACARLGHLPLATPAHRATAATTLAHACSRELPRACLALGHVELARGSEAPDRPRAALTAYLRGCDLGLPDACTAAIPLLKATPFAEAAGVLTQSTPVATKRLGTVFAVRWGQWTKRDGGQPTAWVTDPPAQLPAGAIVTTFEADRIPKGLPVPAGVAAVHAIALDGGSGRPEDRCDRCNPSGGDGAYSIQWPDCVCVLRPER